MSDAPSWFCALHLPAEPLSTARAREFVSLHLLRHDLRHLQEDVRLVVSELVTNAVTHAQTPFTVGLRRQGPIVTVTVRDLSTLVPVMAPERSIEPGGLGLVIVDVLSRDWGVLTHPGGSKSVWAAFTAAAEAPVVAAP